MSKFADNFFSNIHEYIFLRRLFTALITIVNLYACSGADSDSAIGFNSPDVSQCAELIDKHYATIDANASPDNRVEFDRDRLRLRIDNTDHEIQYTCLEATAPLDIRLESNLFNVFFLDNFLIQLVVVTQGGSTYRFTDTTPRPIEFVVKLPEATTNIIEDSAQIDGDVLSLGLGYSGCNLRRIGLYADEQFSINPTTLSSYAFAVEGDGDCPAYFNETYYFDLQPLKQIYQETYGEIHGEIVIEGLGTYQF